MLDITTYRCFAPALSRRYRLALVTDLHNGEYTRLLAAIRGANADAVVIAGDLMGRAVHARENAYAFLSEAAQTHPVFYALGNHESLYGAAEHARIRSTGAVLLVNESCAFGELCIGGIAPDADGVRGAWAQSHAAFLYEFARTEGFRVLLCHRPEWYLSFVRDLDIPLMLAGHAHGGQVRLFGLPVFSPGQGLFPKYAQGMHEGRLIVSRGLGNHTIVPRFFNAPELCIVEIGPEGGARGAC
ncbi:MAG: metallophosphoesterase [Clostridia bacterium]|nr:metallophosphoesterase [Clostridia bacterium]